MTTQTTTTPAVSPLMEIALRIREMRSTTAVTPSRRGQPTRRDTTSPHANAPKRVRFSPARSPVPYFSKVTEVSASAGFFGSIVYVYLGEW